MVGALGTRLPDEQRSLPGPRITNVAPDGISLSRTLMRNEGEVPAGAGVLVTIYGNQLSSDCSLDATVNGRPIELNNLLPQPKGFRGLLLYRDISNREVSARHLEVRTGGLRSRPRPAQANRVYLLRRVSRHAWTRPDTAMNAEPKCSTTSRRRYFLSHSTMSCRSM